MKPFFSQFMIDFIVARRNMFFIIVLSIALLYSMIVNFVIPSKTESYSINFYILDASVNAKYKQALMSSDYKTFTVSSLDSIKESMSKDKSALGLVLKDDGIEIVFQGYESLQQRNIIKSIFSVLYDTLNNQNSIAAYKTTVLKESAKKLPLNMKMIPVLLATDIIMLGFMFVAAMIFQEKKEGGLYAYRVSPGGTLNYILSKVIVNVMISVLFGVVFLFFTLGFKTNYFYFLSIIFLGAFLISLLGIFLAQFYSSLNEFIVVALIFNAVMALPVVSYFNPLIDIQILKIIPSYSLIYASDEIISSVKSSYTLNTLLNLFIQISIFFPATYFSVRKTLIRKVIL